MKAVELFAGVGGFRLGLERAGHEVVYANEWDKYAAQTYKKHFGEIDTRDITTVPADEIPKHDIICGGFPCQTFSIAGKRRGFNETRGTLFFDICRIAQHHRTPYLFLENVKGLLNHDSGRTFETIIRTLDELGYDCQWQVLNSKNFGVPQNRERVFIVGHLRDRPRPQVFPIGENDQLAAEARSRSGEEAEVSNALRAKGQGGRGDVEDSYIVAVNQRNEVRKSKVPGAIQASQSASQFQAVAHTRKGKQGGVGKRVPIIEEQIRRLTPMECERLQGFPDNWTQGQSDTQRYKMMGNAVTVNVIEVIARQLRKSGVTSA